MIIINGIELEESFTAAITYSIASLKDPGKTKGIGSKTITVPRTKTNDKAFGLTYNSNIISSVDKSASQTCIITEGSDVILDGIAKLLSATETEIEFYALAGNRSLKEALGERTLNDLDLSDLNHLYSTAIDTWASPPDDYIYPLIDYGHLYSRDGGATDTTSIDLYPAVYVRRIVEQIFLQAGINFVSDFFLKPEMSRLILAFSGRLSQAPGWVEDRGFRASLTLAQIISGSSQTVEINDDSTSPNFDNGGNFNTSNYRYTASEGMKLDIHLIYSISATSGVSTIALLKNGVTVLASVAVSIGNDLYLSALNVELNAGDYVSVVGNSSGSYTVTAAVLYNEVKPELFSGSTVDMSHNLPNMKQIDFIKGLITLFNWQVDLGDIETFKDFYYGFQDWSDKLDLSKPVVVKYTDDDVPQFYRFRYQENDSFNVLNFNDDNKADFGSGEYDTQNDLNNETEFEVPFAATMISKSYNTASAYLNIPQIIKDEENISLSTQVKNRLLIYAGNQTVKTLSDGTYSEINIDVAPGVADEVPLCYFVKTSYSASPFDLGLDNFKVNLCFDLPIGEWNGRGLLSEFYPNLENYRDLRVLEIYFNLKGADFAELDFSRYIYIQLEGFTGYYILYQIHDYQGGSTKCTLVKIR